MIEIERRDYDLVVIGAGGAGLRAAIEPEPWAKRTAIISKSLFGKAHTVMVEAGRTRSRPPCVLWPAMPGDVPLGVEPQHPTFPPDEHSRRCDEAAAGIL